MRMSNASDTHVVVVGGGGTGAAILYDLVQRGFKATLFERGELTCGSTGRHHGLLHSGARYVVKDREVGRECMDEVRILTRIAPEAIEANRGIFVAFDEEELAFRETFEQACAEADIPAQWLTSEQVLAMEPRLNPGLLGGVMVPDGTLDAYRLPMHFFAGARKLGAVIRNFTRVESLVFEGRRIAGVTVHDLRTGADETVKCDLVINATGGWAGRLAAMADIDLPITPAPGTMLAHQGRLVNNIIERLRPASDGDILVPQRGLSIIGSTQWQTDDPDDCTVPDADVEFLTKAAIEMVPDFKETVYHKAWAAVRPLAGASSTEEEGRELSRDFDVRDHAKLDNVEGMLSLTGGKATTLRAMGEKTVDVVCDLFDVDTPCQTASEPLPNYRHFFRQGVLV